MVCVVSVYSHHCWFNIHTLTFIYVKNFANKNVAKKLINNLLKTSHIELPYPKDTEKKPIMKNNEQQAVD